MNDLSWRMPLAAALVFLGLSRVASAIGQHPIPAPWQQTDVGDVGLAGSAFQSSDGDLLINGAGSDIWGTADSFHFLYQPISDGMIASNYASLENTHPFAKIGLMFRMSLDPGSPEVILDVKPDGTVEFMTRSTPGGETRFIAGLGHHGAMQLIRRDGMVTGIICDTDGCQVVGSTPFPSGPALVGAAITSHDPGLINHGYVAADLPRVSSVPTPWNSFDVGAVGRAGSAQYDNGVFTVVGSGADIWGTADSFHAVTAGIDGDATMLARVTSEDAVNLFAKAGVVMGQDWQAAPSGKLVILDVRPNGAVEFMARSTNGGEMAFIAGTAVSFPAWLKVTRVASNNTFVGWVSSDGHDWQLVGSAIFSMDGPITAGLAVTSHDTSAINTSTFDHVTVASDAWTDIDVGVVGSAGWATFDYSSPPGTPIGSRGAGADIWGNADAFNYLYRTFFGGGDGGIIARITGLDNTDTFAKAGLMLRDTSDAGGAHVLLDVRPNGQIEFMTRSAPGAATTFVSGATTTFPVWLRLSHLGNTTTASISANGFTWTDVGQTSGAIGPHGMRGIAVTSHEFGVLTSATFDHIGTYEAR